MSETFGIAEWLYETLSGDDADVGDRVWTFPAPQSATTPYITFQLQAGSDTPFFGDTPRMMRGTYLVRCIDKGWSKEDASVVADLIDGLLEKATGTGTDVAILGCIRQSPFEMTETSDGEAYQHVGGIYRIIAEATPAQ